MGSAIEWNAETAYVLTLYKYLLRILGIWVLDEENIFSRIRWFLSTIIEVSYTFFRCYQSNLCQIIFS